jgi:uncharacterized membrane protein YdbT with pleckstrin-like domain
VKREQKQDFNKNKEEEEEETVENRKSSELHQYMFFSESLMSITIR